MDPAAAGPAAGAPDPSNDAGAEEQAALSKLALEWLQAMAAGLGASFRLAIAEAKLAAMSLVLMLLFTVLAAILTLGAWGLFLSGIVIVLERLGVPLWASLLGLGLLQVAGAALLFRGVMRLGRRLELAETNRRLESLMGGVEDDDDR